MKRLLILIYVFYGFAMFSQARLNISSGGNVYFHFNSYQKYVNGVTYPNYTKLLISYNDTTVANSFQNWRLDVKALSPNIDGDNPPNTLDLNVIELEANGTGTSTGVQTLSNTDVKLTGGLQPVAGLSNASVFITYYCGVTNKLIGKEPDYYVVDLLFTLTGE